MGIACVGMLSTVTSCKEDEYPDNSIPTPPAAIAPTEPTTQVLWPSNLQRVSVHDPSVVYDPSSWSYYIFGSHRAYAKSPNLMTWTAVAVPWGADGVTGVGNDVAFVKPEVTKVKKGGADVDMPAFNAFEWSGTANPNWSVDGNMWAPDVVYNKEMKKWCMYLSINGDSWYSSSVASSLAIPTRRPTLRSFLVLRSRCPAAMLPATTMATTGLMPSTPACSTTNRASCGCLTVHGAVVSSCWSWMRRPVCVTTT